MPKICYVERNFAAGSMAMIKHATQIIADYARQGYTLTLRQLYYQFVSRDLIPNKQSEYKRLGSVVNDARLAGLIDWNAIEDRTRELRALSHWESPSEIVDAVATQYRIDKWADQPCRIEVWIEKDALVGVFERVCRDLDVPILSCRGYTSQSEMWSASQRLRRLSKRGQQIVILHFGDHDPSGIDMTRDIRDRLSLFGLDLDLRRLALNMDQVDEHKPPPNPAKQTDSRYTGYLQAYGDESWELDALEPNTLAGLVRREVMSLRDESAWETASDSETVQKGLLQTVSDRWDAVASFVTARHDG
jgi:predicted acyl esterase